MNTFFYLETKLFAKLATELNKKDRSIRIY